MARPPKPAQRGDFNEPRDLEEFDAAIARGYQSFSYYGVLLKAPQWGNAISNLAHLLRGAGYRAGGYSHADREWVDQVLSYHWNYYDVLGIHTPDAVAVGVRIEAIEALHEAREDDLTADERLLTDFIRQVVDGTVSHDTFTQMHTRLGGRSLVEYTLFICHLQRVLRSFQAFKIELPGAGTREEVGAIIHGLRDGSVEVRAVDEAVRGRYSSEEEEAVSLDETASALAHLTGSPLENAPPEVARDLLQSPALAAALAQEGLTAEAARNTYAESERRSVVRGLAQRLGYDELATGTANGHAELEDYARSFTDGTVDDEVYARLESRSGTRGAVELTALAGHTMVALRLFQALRAATSL